MCGNFANAESRQVNYKIFLPLTCVVPAIIVRASGEVAQGCFAMMGKNLKTGARPMRGSRTTAFAMALGAMVAMPGIAGAQGFFTNLFGGGTDNANLRATIWVDPDGCEHWAIDDGIEGYMSQHLDLEGKPVCRALPMNAGVCKTFDSAALFETGSASIRSMAMAEIQGYFATIPGSEVIVVGHTDNVGTAEFNLELSKQRAEAVAALARKMGVTAATRGLGEAEPVASNDTEAGRAQNRRVDLFCS